MNEVIYMNSESGSLSALLKKYRKEKNVTGRSGQCVRNNAIEHQKI